MSGIEVLGIAASVIQIANLGAELSVKLFAFGRKVKNADKNIESISQDIAATGAVLQQLGKELTKNEQSKLCSDEAVATARDLITQCEKIFTELNNALEGRDNGNKLVLSWKQRLRYTLLESHVDLLRTNLERLKSSLLVMLHILILAQQIKNHEAVPLLQDQRALIEVLVEDSATTKLKFDRVMKRLETLKIDDAEETHGRPNCNLPQQGQVYLNTVADTQHMGYHQPHITFSTESTSLPVPQPRLEELSEHSCFVSKLIEQVHAVQWKIGHGLRHKMHERVLDVHWEEWSKLTDLYGTQALLQNFSEYEEVARFWRSRLECDAIDKLKSPIHVRSADTSTKHNEPVSNETSRTEADRMSLHMTRSSCRTTMYVNGPVTHTPVIDRVNKAKRGKRTFVCGHSGCGKLFTRAEHKKRHENSHVPDALFPCTRAGCRKAFHRPDLLQRHLERHDLEASEDSSGHGRQASLRSMSAEMPHTTATTSMQSPMTPVTTSQPHSGPISIGSLANQDTLGGAYNGYDNWLGVHATSNYPHLHASFDYALYKATTPDNSMSTRSDEFVHHPHRHNMSSASSAVDYHPAVTSPLVNNILPSNWTSLSTPPTYLTAATSDGDKTDPAGQHRYSSLSGWMDTPKRRGDQMGELHEVEALIMRYTSTITQEEVTATRL